jgi:hypothetical protein
MDLADEEFNSIIEILMRTACEQIEEISSCTVDESLFRYSSSNLEAPCLSIPRKLNPNGLLCSLTCTELKKHGFERTFPFCVGLIAPRLVTKDQGTAFVTMVNDFNKRLPQTGVWSGLRTLGLIRKKKFVVLP